MAKAKRTTKKNAEQTDLMEARMIQAAQQAGFENASFTAATVDADGELKLTELLSIEFNKAMDEFTVTRLVEGSYKRTEPLTNLNDALMGAKESLPETETPQTEEVNGDDVELTEQGDDFSDDPDLFDLTPSSLEKAKLDKPSEDQQLIQVDPPEVPDTTETEPGTEPAESITVETEAPAEEAEEEKMVYVTRVVDGVIRAIPITEAIPVAAPVEAPKPAPTPVASPVVMTTGTAPAAKKAKKEPEVITVCYDYNDKDLLLEMARKWQADPKTYNTKKLYVQFGSPTNSWNGFWEVLKKALVAVGEWNPVKA